MYDVVIIGSGPAGLTASIYAKRAGLKAVTIEKNYMSGGQVLNTYEVDNFPGLPGISGFDMGMKFREHADRLGCEFRTGEVLGISKADGRMEREAGCELKQQYDQEQGAGIENGFGKETENACIKEIEKENICGRDIENDCGKEAAEQLIREGKLQAAGLGMPKEENEKDGRNKGFTVVTDTGDFEAKTILIATGASHAKLNIPGEEELSGMGVSYCATCDGAFFKDKVTAVIGGGDVAVEDAIFLARSCKKVYLIHRRDTLRAAALLQKEVMALPNVEILWDTVAERIEGEDQVEALQIKNVKDQKVQRLPVDGVFVAVGILPASERFRNVAACNEKGYLIAGEDGATSAAGIFAAGDVRTKKLRQIVTAVADGANAITAIQEYLLTGR